MSVGVYVVCVRYLDHFGVFSAFRSGPWSGRPTVVVHWHLMVQTFVLVFWFWLCSLPLVGLLNLPMKSHYGVGNGARVVIISVKIQTLTAGV